MKATIAVVCRVLHELFAEPRVLPAKTVIFYVYCSTEQNKTRPHVYKQKNKKKKETEVSTINSANIQYIHKHMRRTEASTILLLI